MVIRVEQGKGKKDRYVILSPKAATLSCGSIVDAVGIQLAECTVMAGPITVDSIGTNLEPTHGRILDILAECFLDEAA
jgi:hypothetical protein